MFPGNTSGLVGFEQQQGVFAPNTGLFNNPGAPNSPVISQPNVPNNQTPLPIGQNGGTTSNQTQFQFSPINTGDGGGGGAYGVGFDAGAAQKKLIEDKKNSMIDGVNQRYNDQMLDFDNSQKFLTDETGRQKDYVGQTRDQAINMSKQAMDDSSRKARQNYMDSVLMTRRRTRAVGGAGSSGFLELTNMLDRELSNNITGINVSGQNAISQANTVAQRALGDLDASLNKAIAAIESDRRTSAREKNQAIKEAEFAAAEQALQVDQWVQEVSSRMAGSNAKGQADAERSATMQAYLTDLARANSGQAGISAQEVQAYYAPMLAAVGANPGQLSAYEGMTGYINPNSVSEREKFEADQNAKYYGYDQQYNQGILDLYDPFTGTLNPLADLVYPGIGGYYGTQSVGGGNPQGQVQGNLTPQQMELMNMYNQIYK